MVNYSVELPVAAVLASSKLERISLNKNNSSIANWDEERRDLKGWYMGEGRWWKGVNCKLHPRSRGGYRHEEEVRNLGLWKVCSISLQYLSWPSEVVSIGHIRVWKGNWVEGFIGGILLAMQQMGEGRRRGMRHVLFTLGVWFNLTEPLVHLISTGWFLFDKSSWNFTQTQFKTRCPQIQFAKIKLNKTSIYQYF